jgi:hypothetical protein
VTRAKAFLIAEVLCQFLRVLGGEKLVGPCVNLPLATFCKKTTPTETLVSRRI